MINQDRTVTNIPQLEYHCGSWIVWRKETGEVIGEFFNPASLLRFNPEKVTIETANQYLCKLNKVILGFREKGLSYDNLY